MPTKATIRLAAAADMAINGGYVQVSGQQEMARSMGEIRLLLGSRALAMRNFEGSLNQHPSTGSPRRSWLRDDRQDRLALRVSPHRSPSESSRFLGADTRVWMRLRRTRSPYIWREMRSLAPGHQQMPGVE